MSSSRPLLEGIRVLDLSRVLAGPFCTQVLADLGADCIKVERPSHGDDTRHWGPPFFKTDGGELSAYFLSVNRNKRSVAIDLSKPGSRGVLDDLVKCSDVLVENFLPASAARLGLSAERLEKLNPKLVRCSITGFGRTGPWKDRPGYDFVIQALSGMMAITGEPDGEPMKVGVAISDVLTGLYAAISILSGLVARSKTSAGTSFDLSLLDCTVASLVNVAQAYLVSRETPIRYGNAHAQIVPYQCFATADGHLVLAVGNDEQWQRFCTAAGRDDLGADARFATNPLRVENRAALVPHLQKLLRERSTEQWSSLLTAADVSHAPVLGVPEAFAHPQVRARDMVIETQITNDPEKSMELIGAPIRIAGARTALPSCPPRLGEHTEAVLVDVLGYSAERIAELRRQEVIA